MDSNSIPKDAFNLVELAKKAAEFKNIVEALKTGEGLGLNDEQKVEFKKQMEGEGPAQAVKEVSTQFENLQSAIFNMSKAKEAATKKPQ